MTSGTTPIRLSVSDLSKRYGGAPAVDGVSFQLGKGECFTLLGPSGCGKSTTLMSLAGLISHESGRVELDGLDITHLAPERRGMGVVFQNYALFPHMTVLQNVMFPLLMRDVRKEAAAARARDALRLVRLDIDGASPTQISGGQMQRVALARALVFDPAVLLMDEPLGALDRRLRAELQLEFRVLQERLGTTVLWVTHDQEEALVLSDRIAIMRDGRIEQVASPAQVYTEPANTFVASFLGDVNTVHVRIVEATQEKVIFAPLNDEAHKFQAIGGDGLGDVAVLTIRPERLSLLSAHENGRTGYDGCQAVIRDVIFLGDRVRVEVEVFGGQIWTVVLPPNAVGGSWARRGAVVALGWRQVDARLLAS